MAVTAGAFPDVKGSSPISVSRKTPVLNVLEPVTKAALTDRLGNPVDCVVVSDNILTHLGHLDEPGVACVVNKGSVTSPAMGVLVLKLGSGEELALAVEVCYNHGVSLLDEYACVGGLLSHLALAVNELNEGKAVLPAYLRVVLTECGRDMNDTRTVGHGYVAVADNVVSLELLPCRLAAGALEEGLILAVFKSRAGHSLEYLVCGSAVLALKAAENALEQCLCHIVGVAVARLNLAIGVLRVYAERNVRGKGPGGGCPSEEVCVLTHALEACNSRALLDSLISLCNLVRGEGSATAGAVGNDLEALVEKALVPDFLKRPPLGLDKVVCVGYVRMLHISPEADGAGEVLPHSLVGPDRLLTVCDERLKTVCLDLILAVDAELLLDLKLNGQTVSIPTRLTKHALALHRVISRNHILDNTGEDVTYMRLTVCGRGTVEEGVVLAARAHLNALLEYRVSLPECAGLLFSFHKIEVG